MPSLTVFLRETWNHAVEPDETWNRGNIGSNECYRFYTSTNQNKRIFHINELINSTFGPYLIRAHNV